MKKRGEDGHLQVKAGSLERNQSCWNTDLRLNLQNCEEINFYCVSLPLCATLYGSPSKLMQEVSLAEFWLCKVRTGIPKLFFSIFFEFFCLMVDNQLIQLQASCLYPSEEKREENALLPIKNWKMWLIIFYMDSIMSSIRKLKEG